jgi:predicted lipoprotein with Yx(FWY)xxD motif
MNITEIRQNGPLLRSVLAGAALSVALIVAGCSGGTPSPGSAPGSSASSGSTVTVRDASGHSGVLATADGRTLYVSDQENGTVLCKSSACTAIWNPLTVDTGQAPTGSGQLAGKLSTLKRPDGSTQVAFDHKPLYTFSFDHGAGQVGGDGQQDSFDGTHFTWRVATAAGGSAPASTTMPSAPSSSGNGGYTY